LALVSSGSHAGQKSQLTCSRRSTHSRRRYIESFLPALLYVKLLSTFDEALEEYIILNRSTLLGNYGGTLHKKLEFLDGHGVLHYSTRLHDIRNKRNSIGHQPTTPANWQAQQVTWQDLDQAVDDIESVLQQLGLVGNRPAYEPFCERASDTVPADKPDVYMTHTYRYGIKENGNIIILFTHTFDYYRLSDDMFKSATA
jgi:hypothetical protein